MNIDETVKALRWIASNDEVVFNAEQANIAADQLEQLQAENEQLKASQPVRCGECIYAEHDEEGYFCGVVLDKHNISDIDYCSYVGRRE